MTAKTKKLMMPKEILQTNVQVADPQQDGSKEVDTDSHVQKKTSVQLDIAKRRAERDFIVTGRWQATQEADHFYDSSGSFVAG